MFDTHRLNDTGFAAMTSFKEKMAQATREAIALMPDGREKSIFITKLEEAVFFGAKAIASKQENHESKTEY